MTQMSEIAGNRTHRFRFPAAMASATTDDEQVLLVAEANFILVSCFWTPDAAVTANGTNYSVLSVRNRTGADAGTALPFQRSYAATNSVARVKETMTASGTAADLLVASGDVLTVQRIHTASGVVIPVGLLELNYRLR